MKAIVSLATVCALVPLQEDGPAGAAELHPQGNRVQTLVASLAGGSGGMAVDAEGFVYCADFGSKLGSGSKGGHRVYKIDPVTGETSIFANTMRGASGNAFGPGGDFFQSNIGGNSIARIEPDGTTSVFLRSGLKSPVGIAIDGEGTLFVANCGSASIVAVTVDGEFEVLVSDRLLSCPNGIALDEEHNFYVANFNNGDVIKIAWSGEVERLTTLPGGGNGHLTYRDGFLYVVARNAHQIYRVSLDGEVELFAGSGQRGHDDGPALEASFSYPNDLAFSPDGKTLYVNENASITEPGGSLAPMTVRRIRLGE